MADGSVRPRHDTISHKLEPRNHGVWWVSVLTFLRGGLYLEHDIDGIAVLLGGCEVAELELDIVRTRLTAGERGSTYSIQG